MLQHSVQTDRFHLGAPLATLAPAEWRGWSTCGSRQHHQALQIRSGRSIRRGNWRRPKGSIDAYVGSRPRARRMSSVLEQVRSRQASRPHVQPSAEIREGSTGSVRVGAIVSPEGREFAGKFPWPVQELNCCPMAACSVGRCCRFLRDFCGRPPRDVGRRRIRSDRYRFFYTKCVTVKLLPLDNKSELSVSIGLPC